MTTPSSKPESTVVVPNRDIAEAVEQIERGEWVTLAQVRAWVESWDGEGKLPPPDPDSNTAG